MPNNSMARKVVNLRVNNINHQTETLLENARRICLDQSRAIARLADHIGDDYSRAIDILLDTKGHVIVSGIGKSGIIGKKMAATFASTGTPSFFVHPAEAFHGDLGMITRDDTLILISNSGETEEVIRLIPYFKQLEIPIIGFAGNTSSTLSRHSDVVVDISVEREACPNNLAPTNSTLATLAMGDILAVTLMNQRNFKPRDFARFHPGGNLGRRLLSRVVDVMHRGDIPSVLPSTAVYDTLVTMTEGRLGLVLAMENGKLRGIVTDGDLRRALQKYDDLKKVKISDIMSPEPISVFENTMLVEAEDKMKKEKIKALVVLDDFRKVTGLLEIFDD